MAWNYAANYNGSNGTSHTMFVMVTSSAQSGCSTNDYGAYVYVNGAMVAQNIDFNSNYAKSKTVTVPVPPGGSYSVVSYRYVCNVMHNIFEYR